MMVIEILVAVLAGLGAATGVAGLLLHRSVRRSARAVEQLHANKLEQLKVQLEAKSKGREHYVELGIDLAERMAHLQRGPTNDKKLLTSEDKRKMAVDFAVEQAAGDGQKLPAAEARKLLEALLERKKNAAPDGH